MEQRRKVMKLATTITIMEVIVLHKRGLPLLFRMIPPLPVSLRLIFYCTWTSWSRFSFGTSSTIILPLEKGSCLNLRPLYPQTKRVYLGWRCVCTTGRPFVSNYKCWRITLRSKYHFIWRLLNKFDLFVMRHSERSARNTQSFNVWNASFIYISTWNFKFPHQHWRAVTSGCRRSHHGRRYAFNVDYWT